MKKVVAASLCLSFFAFGPSSALGGAAADVQVIVKMSPPLFHGKVVSSKAECREHRTVLFYREKASGDKIVGDDETSGQSRWKILAGEQFTVKPGEYYAKAPALSLESGVECKQDKSPKIPVEAP